jgi:hypothetical protein
MGKSDSNEKPTGKSFPFVHGTAYINKGTESYILSFTKNKVYYQLAVQNSILPKDEAKAMEELKKIAASFQLVTR